ncbi:leucine-rich repeat-containing G-protein coupled receptor 5-like isoform X2 [Contarinia nasturtii]|uniref:leucine-rich repeat-containing G-protein coupled receptor 5-like isoform X2 n=1 Tax=Contarinia nasturtii TaxID=265458 RepID=UPI0012D4A4C0|nr:leucine-rich repeat-containing G-protein coupled receptor 5-like isoform X2 [Contarinia nasturtii]
MAWVRGLLVLLTISVNVGVVHMAEPTTTMMTAIMTTKLSSMLPTSASTLPFEWTTKFKPKTTPTTQKKVKPKPSMSESVVILTPDSDRQTKDIYDKALKQFDSYGVSTRQLCATWEKRGCQCSGTVEELTLSCRSIGLNETPTELPKNLIKLDLGNNNITTLPNRSFDAVPHLEELILSDNSLLHIDSDAFIGLNKLKRLSLHNCGLSVIPGKALSHLPHLNALNLGGNHLLNINVGDFPKLDNLRYLTLKRNRLTNITAAAISNLSNIRVLDLDDNLLTLIPYNLTKLTHLQELFLSGNRINTIHKDELPANLIILELRGNPLGDIQFDALHSMPRLRKLVLSDAKSLSVLPSFEGCPALEILRMDRANISIFPNTLCRNSSRLKSIELKSNRLRSVPDLSHCKDLRILDLSDNRITSIHETPFKGLGQLHDLLLSYNKIETIPKDAFDGVPRLQLLDLEGNKISFIHDESFMGFEQLEDLNLGNNIFPTLPKNNMQNIRHLKTFNNPKLREFPPPETFPRIQTLVLSYAYHCCAFLPLVTMKSKPKTTPIQETILFPTDSKFDMSLWNSSQTDIWPQLHNLSKKFGSQINELWDSFGQDFTYPGNLPTYVEEYYEEEMSPTRALNSDLVAGSVQCLPLPGPFLPCQDLFDWWTLRCGVWVVFLLAMLGNGTVVFVLIFSRSKMDVPRFLVCNLAAADFFMGIYLGILAVVDASTLGEFRMFAIPWQMSVGCQIAGFLAVLSSELSVYTLAVITLERNYAITHAMHLNKRLSLRHAGYIMIFGWLFSFTMASLPLIGISDYRKFAICLPFETTNGPASLAYVIFLMFINGVAFVILMGCYLKMYCAIRGSQAWNSNDSRIAKRMALLVFTDFLCWSPIAFLSITAVFGVHLINLNQAKVFTVFVLPLNSCCNPFLYAIMTKQFKKDCVLICKTIEESRVTRGIGRCRHSSNFSNRQTPANTNSLGERSSKDLPPLMTGQMCACSKLLEHSIPHDETPPKFWKRIWNRVTCKKPKKRSDIRRDIRCDQYAYKIAEIQQKPFKRASSVSSDNFSSSRSDSWRHGPPHHCSIPLRVLDTRRRHSSWLVTRKTSQDSNLSSSRNDSSASGTTASTSTFRLSRSSAACTTPTPSLTGKSLIISAKPRLVRQHAVQEEHNEPSCSSPRLSVRFLPTIPSAADSSCIIDEESCNEPSTASTSNNNNNVGSTTNFYTILQSGNPLTTLSSPKSNKIDKPP